MSDIKKFNLFILISTISRNIIEVFSSVLLYKMGYSIKDIMLFYLVMYITAIFINIISLRLVNIINYKYILIISSLIYSYAFYFLNNMNRDIISLIIFSIILSTGSYAYHAMRHFLAINVLGKDKRKGIGNILIFNHLAIMISSYIGAVITNKLGLNYVVIIIIILSIIGIIPIINLKDKIKKEKIKIDVKKINFNRILFFVFEQFKVMFLVLQPLYLYIYVERNIEYIGIFNIVMGIASIIFVYFFVRKSKVNKIFWFLNILFCLVLMFKINLENDYILLVIAFLEGLFTRMYEVVSSENLYDCDKGNAISYLLVVESIFSITNTIIYLTYYLFDISLKFILYICIIGILISGFVRYRKKLK